MIPRLLRFGAALMCANSSLVHAQPLAAWHFNLERLSADSGYAELETARTLGSFASGTGSGKAWSLRSFAPQSTESGQRGWQLTANTVGMDSVWLSGLMRGSPTSSRWWSVQISVDSGATWTSVWQPDTGWGPFDAWVPFSVALPGAEGRAHVGVRAVSVFAPVAFANFGSAYAANQAYQGMRVNPTSATQNYSTSGTWRWENVALRGLESPATQWNGQQWSAGTPQGATNAEVLGAYTGAGFTCANLRVAPSAVLSVLPGGAVDVRGRAILEGHVVLQADSQQVAQLRLASAGWGSGSLQISTVWADSGWHQFASPFDQVPTASSGILPFQQFTWNADSGAYRVQGIPIRGQGSFAVGRGSVQLEGALSRQPWKTWYLDYTASPVTSSAHFSTAVTDGWNLLGNPFACGLDFSLVTRSNVDASYSIWNPELFGGLGAYEYYSPSGGSLPPVVPPLSGFWVRAQAPGAQLTTPDQGSLAAGSLNPGALKLQMQDLAQPDWTADLWLYPDDQAREALDLERDGAVRWSPAPLRWCIEATDGDAFAKRWNPDRGAWIRTQVDSVRDVILSTSNSGGPVWLVGEGHVIPVGAQGSLVRLVGTQRWRVVGGAVPAAEIAAPKVRTGPGFLWIPQAEEVRVANLVGQVLLDAPRAEGQALAHSLPHGLYLVRYRMGGTWSSVKLILQP
jgi:hypothetical protein